MLQSMTGYGVGFASSENYSVKVELKSLNSKNIEFYLKLPGHYFQQELELKNYLSQRLSRGKVTINLVVEVKDSNILQGYAQINTNLLQSYYLQLEELRKRLNTPQSIDLNSLMALPNVITENITSVSEEEWSVVMDAVKQAADALIESRKTEGVILKKDLEQRVHEIDKLILDILPHETNRIENLKLKIRSGFLELSELYPLNEERYQQELFFYLEKYDISEEKVRLKTHLNHFLATLNENSESHGRKLQFLTQELYREANTLGVKAYDATIQYYVVCIKEEIEKMKEQLMNIL